MTAVLIVGVPVGAALIAAAVTWSAAIVAMHRLITRLAGSPA